MSRRRPVDTSEEGGARRATRRPRREGRSARAARRARRRVLSVTLVALLGLASLGALGWWGLHQPLFQVRHATVVGVTHESAAAVLVASGLDAHPAMISVSTGEVERRLRRFPWIGSVVLVKHWPDSVALSVHERVAVAVALAGTSWRYVDASGHDLGPAPRSANLPTLVALSARGWPYLGWARPAAEVASRLPTAFAAQVSKVIVDHRGSVSLKLTTPVTFVLGSLDDLHAKFVDVASVIAHATLAPGDVVDVTAPGALAVTGPTPG